MSLGLWMFTWDWGAPAPPPPPVTYYVTHLPDGTVSWRWRPPVIST